jgi:hypothetical protein
VSNAHPSRRRHPGTQGMVEDWNNPPLESASGEGTPSETFREFPNNSALNAGLNVGFSRKLLEIPRVSAA